MVLLVLRSSCCILCYIKQRIQGNSEGRSSSLKAFIFRDFLFEKTLTDVSGRGSGGRGRSR